MSKTKIELPECGLLFGNAIYNTYAGYPAGCWIGSTWSSDSTPPMELLDRTVEENQGNLVQFWWFDGGCRPQTKARYLALEDLNITIPAPDFKTGKNTTLAEFDCFAKYGEERAGAGVLKALKHAKDLGLYTTMIYCNGVNPAISAEFEKLAPSYIGYDLGEIFSFRDDSANASMTNGVNLHVVAEDLMKRLSDYIRQRKADGYGNICCTSGNFFMDYEIAAGADFTMFEDCVIELNIASALSRGLSKQFELGLWGSHIANEYYTWLPYDNKYLYDTLRTQICMKYLAGAKIIVVESGAWHCQAGIEQWKAPRIPLPISSPHSGAEYTSDAKDAIWMPLVEEVEKHYPMLDINCEHSRHYRKTVSDFYDFVKANGTPAGQPEVTVAVAKGNLDLSGYGLDGYNHGNAIAGLNSLADKDPRWHEDTPEQGWEAVSKVFFPRQHDVLDIDHYNRLYSGTPWGQIDVVSFINDQITSDFLVKNYKALLFSGWNTSSEKQYATLLDYVNRGGILFIGIPYFSTDATRNFSDYTVDDLVRKGDFSELCGVKVKGPGPHFYWCSLPAGCKTNVLGGRNGMGAYRERLGDIEIVDPAAEVLLYDNESFVPILLHRKCGKGQVFFLNSWGYFGGFTRNYARGSRPDDAGMTGAIYRYITKLVRSDVYITDVGLDDPYRECNYVNYSYFPEDGTICLFNVDFVRPHTFDLHRFGKTETVTLAPQELRLLKKNS